MLALAPIVLLAVASAPDELDEVVRRSAEIPHFSATFSLTFSDRDEVSTVGIEVGGPTRVRVEIFADDKRATVWAVDGVFATQMEGCEEPVHVRVDCREIYALFDAVDEQFCREFPEAKPRGDLCSVASMNWMYDESADKANYQFTTSIGTGAGSAMGWLDTLVQKGATPVVEGELLRFSTDGHFDISVSRATGMLQEFRGRSPKAEMRMVLKSVDFVAAPPAERFEVPATPAGSEDVSAEFRKTMALLPELEFRKRIYKTLAAASGPLEGPESDRDLVTLKVRSLLRRFHEITLAPVVAQAHERIAEARGQALERLKEWRDRGATPEELSAWIERQATLIEEHLADFDKSIPARTAPPSGTQELPNAEALSAVEAAVLHDLWRDSVVEPLMAECRRAFEEAAR